MSKFNRFEFEQQIMECWGVTIDIQALIKSYDSLSEDQRMNILIGMKDLYDAKFNVLWDQFEQMIVEEGRMKAEAKPFNAELHGQMVADRVNEVTGRFR